MTARQAAPSGIAGGDPVGRFLSWIWALGTAAGLATLATTTTAELGHRDALSAMTVPDAGFPAR